MRTGVRLILGGLLALLSFFAPRARAGLTVYAWEDLAADGMMQPPNAGEYRVLTLPFASSPEDADIARAAGAVVHLAMFSGLRAGERAAFGRATAIHIAEGEAPTAAVRASAFASQIGATATLWGQVYRVGGDLVVQPFLLIDPHATEPLVSTQPAYSPLSWAEDLELFGESVQVTVGYQGGSYRLPPFVLSGDLLRRFQDDTALTACSLPRPCQPDPTCGAGAACSVPVGMLGPRQRALETSNGYVKIDLGGKQRGWVDLRDLQRLSPGLDFAAGVLKAIRGDRDGALKQLTVVADGAAPAGLRLDAALIISILRKSTARLESVRAGNPSSDLLVECELLVAMQRWRFVTASSHDDRPVAHPDEWAALLEAARRVTLYAAPADPAWQQAARLQRVALLGEVLRARAAAASASSPSHSAALNALRLDEAGAPTVWPGTPKLGELPDLLDPVPKMLAGACAGGDSLACVEAALYTLATRPAPDAGSVATLDRACVSADAVACSALGLWALQGPDAAARDAAYAHLDRACVLGLNSPCLSLVALSLDQPGGGAARPEAAADLTRRAIEARRAKGELDRALKLGDDVAERLISAHALSSALLVYHDADAIYLAQHDRKDPEYRARLRAHAALAAQVGPAAALGILDELVQVEIATHGRDSLEVASALLVQADALARSGDAKQAASAAHEAIEIRKALLGRKNPLTKQAMGDYSRYTRSSARGR